MSTVHNFAYSRRRTHRPLENIVTVYWYLTNNTANQKTIRAGEHTLAFKRNLGSPAASAPDNKDKRSGAPCLHLYVHPEAPVCRKRKFLANRKVSAALFLWLLAFTAHTFYLASSEHSLCAKIHT